MATSVQIKGSSAVVVDNGSEFSRAGFAGEESPRVTFPAVVGRSHGIVDVPKEICIGNEALNKRGILTLKYPIEHGIITSFEDMEQVRKCNRMAVAIG